MPAIYGCIVEWCYPATFAWSLSCTCIVFNISTFLLSSHYALVGFAHLFGFYKCDWVRLKPWPILCFRLCWFARGYSERVRLGQGWVISGPRAICGPPQRFQCPTEAFRKNHQVWNFVELITVNVVVQAIYLKLRLASISTGAVFLNLRSRSSFRVRDDISVTICLTCRVCV